MHALGTLPHYAGLFGAVESLTPVSDGQLDAAPADFPAQATLSNVASAMVAIGRSWERLQVLGMSGWKPPDAHPDLDPANEAVILPEGFREMRRLPEAASRPDAFCSQVVGAESDAWQLAQATDCTTRDRLLHTLASRCDSCHARYRDRL